MQQTMQVIIQIRHLLFVADHSPESKQQWIAMWESSCVLAIRSSRTCCNPKQSPFPKIYRFLWLLPHFNRPCCPRTTLERNPLPVFHEPHVPLQRKRSLEHTCRIYYDSLIGRQWTEVPRADFCLWSRTSSMVKGCLRSQINVATPTKSELHEKVAGIQNGPTWRRWRDPDSSMSTGGDPCCHLSNTFSIGAHMLQVRLCSNRPLYTSTWFWSRCLDSICEHIFSGILSCQKLIQIRWEWNRNCGYGALNGQEALNNDCRSHPRL